MPQTHEYRDAIAAKSMVVFTLVLMIVTPLAVTSSVSIHAVSNLAGYLSQMSPAPQSNGIINGGFEKGNFSGWTIVGSPTVTSNPTLIYRGSDAAVISNSTDSFFQPLNYTMLTYSVFGFAMLGGVSISDTNWHEVRLTIKGNGLATIYLHYVLQGTKPTDTATDKYFKHPGTVNRWIAVNRPLMNDLIEKGITQYAGGTVTNITCQQGGSGSTTYDEFSLTEYDPSSGPTPNALVNGGFEYQSFTGWTTAGTPPAIIDYNISQVYEGFFSACNSHYYDSFYQPLNFAIYRDTNFSAALLAVTGISDSSWHEIMLTVDEAGSGTVRLHYRLQTNQPQDTVTDKYFLIGSNLEQWYVLNRNILGDLIAKRLSPDSTWRITLVTCQQSGVSNTVFDALRLWGTSGLIGGGGGGGVGGSSGSYVLVAIPIVAVILVFMAILVMRRGLRESDGNELAHFPRKSGQTRPYDNKEPEKPLSVSPRLTCPECGAPVKYAGAEYCFSCGASLRGSSQRTSVQALRGKGLAQSGTCIVCGLRIAEGDEILHCPYCGNVAHRDHMLEWIHVKDSCPICGTHLNNVDFRN